MKGGWSAGGCWGEIFTISGIQHIHNVVQPLPPVQSFSIPPKGDPVPISNHPPPPLP